jgi:lysophospholipase L1-like esterase
MHQGGAFLRRAIAVGLGGIFAIVLFLGSAELAARLLFDLVTPQSGRKALSQALDPAGEGVGWQFYRPHPYMLYELTPGVIDTNSLGYRGAEFNQTAPEGVLRILTLGGSTTWGDGATDWPATWSAALERLLRARGVLAEVVNGGLSAATSAEIAAHFVHRHQALKPDLVILHVGWNDVGPLLLSTYDPTYRSFRGWKAPPLSLRPMELQMLQSKFMQMLYTWWFKDADLLSLLMFPNEFYDVDGVTAMANVARHEPTGFARNLQAILAMSKALGAEVVLYPVPVAPRQIFELTPAPAAERTWEARLAALEKNRGVMRVLAARRGVTYWQGPEDLLSVEHFTDHAHTNDAGHARKAQFLADQLCTSGLLRAMGQPCEP